MSVVKISYKVSVFREFDMRDPVRRAADVWRIAVAHDLKIAAIKDWSVCCHRLCTGAVEIGIWGNRHGDFLLTLSPGDYIRYSPSVLPFDGKVA